MPQVIGDLPPSMFLPERLVNPRKHIINLPISFTATNYKIFLTHDVWDSNSATYIGQQRNKTINSFNVQTTANNANWQGTISFTGFYYCIGY